MKENMKSWQSATVLVGMIVGMLVVSTPRAWAHVIPPDAHSFGKSYGEWTAEWWKWHLSLSASNHPAFSVDGANCGAGQSGKVWFLNGTFTTEVPENAFATIVRESCTIPTGKALFFPILNVDCSTLEGDPFHLVEDGPDANVDTCAASFFDGPIAVAHDLTMTIDGQSLINPEAYRFQSPVFDFAFSNPADNILGVDCNIADCDNARAVSDGYWVMVPPLSAGTHTIRFTGSFRDPQTNDLIFGLDVTYELAVVGGRK